MQNIVVSFVNMFLCILYNSQAASDCYKNESYQDRSAARRFDK